MSQPVLGRLLLVLVLALLSLPAGAADYAREQKWADEILPGVVVGDPVWLEAAGHRFLALHADPTAAVKKRAAVVLIHGIGVHPDWGLIGALRARLADAGHTTLSIQMPVLGADAGAEAYVPLLPEAAARIDVAVGRLRGTGHGLVAVVAHSLGARMANEYFVRYPGGDAAGYVAIGLSGPWPDALPPTMPVLDLYGSADLPQVLATAQGRRSAARKLPKLRQSEISGADHFFTGAEQRLADAVDDFLATAVEGR